MEKLHGKLLYSMCLPFCNWWKYKKHCYVYECSKSDLKEEFSHDIFPQVQCSVNDYESELQNNHDQKGYL